jgi:putative regulatory protein, FmdB family
MPIYEYACGACGRPSEIMHKMSDPPATVCPLCGAAALTKQISAAGFRLKGGGWYETDFKKEGRRNLADGGTSTAATGDAKPDSKPAESKPAEKTAPAAAATPVAGASSGASSGGSAAS